MSKSRLVHKAIILRDNNETDRHTDVRQTDRHSYSYLLLNRSLKLYNIQLLPYLLLKLNMHYATCKLAKHLNNHCNRKILDAGWGANTSHWCGAFWLSCLLRGVTVTISNTHNYECNSFSCHPTLTSKRKTQTVMG